MSSNGWQVVFQKSSHRIKEHSLHTHIHGFRWGGGCTALPFASLIVLIRMPRFLLLQMTNESTRQARHPAASHWSCRYTSFPFSCCFAERPNWLLLFDGEVFCLRLAHLQWQWPGNTLELTTCRPWQIQFASLLTKYLFLSQSLGSRPWKKTSPDRAPPETASSCAAWFVSGY